MNKEELETARKQLHELALKLGVQVDGCGCCRSPWLTSVDDASVVVLDDVRIGKPDTENTRQDETT